MDFIRTPHVRIFTETTPTGKLHGFFGRVLFEQLLKTANRAGVIELPQELLEDLPSAVAVMIDCPDPEWVREHLPKLMKGSDPSVVLLKERYLVIPRYIEAQYSRIDTTFSAAQSKQKRADIAEAVNLGLITSDLAKTA